MPQLRSWCAKHARVAHAININIIFNYCTRLRVAVAIVYVCCNCMLLKLLVLCMVLNAFVYVYTHVHTCTSYMWPALAAASAHRNCKSVRIPHQQVMNRKHARSCQCCRKRNRALELQYHKRERVREFERSGQLQDRKLN